MVELPISSSVRRPKLRRSLRDAIEGCSDADKAAPRQAAEANQRRLLLALIIAMREAYS